MATNIASQLIGATMDSNILRAYARAISPGHSLFKYIHSRIWNGKNLPGRGYLQSFALHGILSQLEISTETVAYFEKGERKDTTETVYCKNLFLKDRKGTFYMIVCHEDTDVDLKYLKRVLNAHRNFSFANYTDVLNILNTDGFVTPFCLMFPSTRKVKVVFEESLRSETSLNFHPLHSDLTSRVSFHDLTKFLTYWEKEYALLPMNSGVLSSRNSSVRPAEANNSLS